MDVCRKCQDNYSNRTVNAIGSDVLYAVTVYIILCIGERTSNGARQFTDAARRHAEIFRAVTGLKKYMKNNDDREIAGRVNEIFIPRSSFVFYVVAFLATCHVIFPTHGDKWRACECVDKITFN